MPHSAHCEPVVKPIRLRSRRGRPRQESRPKGSDCGTPELALKHAIGLTCEAIDLCRRRNLLTDEQHWCALHFRWLYAVRYGVPGVTALDIARGTGRECYAEEDEDWRIFRERDYFRALTCLKHEHADGILIRLSVYNEPLLCMKHGLLQRAWSDATLRHSIEDELARLHAGLDSLVELWGKIARGVKKN